MAISLAAKATVISGGGGPAGTASVPAPAGLSASMLDLLLFAIRDSNGNSTISLGTDGGAYTSVAGGNANQNGSIQADFTLARKTGAASPGNVAVTFNNSYNRHHAGVRMAWSGVDLATPIDVQSASLTAGNVASAATPTFTVPAITTVTDGAVALGYVIVATASADEPGAFTGAAGWTPIFTGNAYYGSSSISLALCRKFIPTAGTTGAFAPVLSADAGTINDVNWLGGIVALRPDLTTPPAVMRSRANFLGL